MNRDVLRAAAAGETAKVRDYYYSRKAPAIRRAAGSARYYVESNHQFVKSFAAHAVEDLGESLVAIHLVRDPIEVALSICSLGSSPGTAPDNDWWLAIFAKNPSSQPHERLKRRERLTWGRF